MENDQKTSYSTCIVIKNYNFKVLPALLHGCHTLQVQNVAIPATFSPYNFKILLTLHMKLFWIGFFT